MNIIFDNLVLQSPNQWGAEAPFVAEIGVILERTTEPDTVDVPEGYYYVTTICKNGDERKRYIVSKVSIIEHIYGYMSDDEEMPEFLESYLALDEAKKSKFWHFFDYENHLIGECF